MPPRSCFHVLFSLLNVTVLSKCWFGYRMVLDAACRNAHISRHAKMVVEIVFIVK